MRVYFDTGVFIDFLSTQGVMNALLRPVGRRGRTPTEMAVDAQRLFEKVSRGHTGATSCLTYYEVEEALYRLLARPAKGSAHADMWLIPAARSIATQALIVVEAFNLTALDLTSGTVRTQFRQLDLQTRGIRAADALHGASAIEIDADLLKDFERITIDPAQMGGVPCVRHLRIPVVTVLRLLAGRMAEDEILSEYTDLEPADIRECLRFAAVSMMEREIPLPYPT